MERVAWTYKERCTPFAKNTLYMEVRSRTQRLNCYRMNVISGTAQQSGLPWSMRPKFDFGLDATRWFSLFIHYFALLREDFPTSRGKQKQNKITKQKRKKRKKQEHLISFVVEIDLSSPRGSVEKLFSSESSGSKLNSLLILLLSLLLWWGRFLFSFLNRRQNK